MELALQKDCKTYFKNACQLGVCLSVGAILFQPIDKRVLWNVGVDSKRGSRQQARPGKTGYDVYIGYSYC